MYLENNEESYAVAKFESMLKENNILFFDVDEFEEIIEYYLQYGRISKAKRALDIGLSQHPYASSLKLLYAEELVFEDRLDEATRKLLNYSYTLLHSPMSYQMYMRSSLWNTPT